MVKWPNGSRYSQTSVDSMSDIVWAVNPNKDHLRDLALRMRRFASDRFSARNIEFHFNAPDAERDMKVRAEMRRELFLIFKESVNNCVKHSGCSQANITLRIAQNTIELEVYDNGKGFNPASDNGGSGLASMRQRAIRIGGELQVLSSTGEGTTVRLTARL